MLDKKNPYMYHVTRDL